MKFWTTLATILTLVTPLKLYGSESDTCNVALATLLSSEPTGKTLGNVGSVGGLIFNVLSNALGERLSDSKLKVRVLKKKVIIPAITLKDGIVLPEYIVSSSDDSKDVKAFEKTDKSGKLIVEVILPRNDLVILTEDTELFLLNIFRSHPVHPYVASSYLKKSYFKPKPPQVSGVRALEKAIELEHSSFAFAGTTALGKTYVAIESLKVMLKTLEPGLIVLTADQNHVLLQNLESMIEQDPVLREQFSDDSALINWTKNDSGNTEDLIRLANERRAEGKFTFLFTTVRSLTLEAFPGAVLKDDVGLTYEEQQENLEELSTIVKAVIYDEVHHAGANNISSFLNLLKEQTNELQKRPYFLLGLTATLFHYKVNLINDLFENRVFLAMTHDEDSYFEQTTNVLKEDVFIEELLKAIRKSYVNSVYRSYMLLPGHNGVPEDLHIQKNLEDGNTRYSLNEDRMSWLISVLKSKLKSHKSIFITTPTIDDTNMVQNFIKDLIPEVKSEVVHSGMGDSLRVEQEKIKGLLNDSVNVLITVRKGDEGLDMKGTSLYIDLNKSVGPRQVLQRLGRVLRLSEGKQNVELVTLFDATAFGIMESLQNYNQMLDSGFYAQDPISDPLNTNSSSDTKKPNEFSSEIDQVSIVFDKENHQRAASQFAEVLSEKLLESNQVAFYENDFFGNSKLVVEERRKFNIREKDAWALVESWLDKGNKLPLTDDEDSLKGDEQAVLHAVASLGGLSETALGLLRRDYIDKNAFDVMAKEIQEKTGEVFEPKKDRMKKFSLEDVSLWLKLKDEWPTPKSLSSYEKGLYNYINQTIGGRKKIITEELIELTPYLKFTHTDINHRFSILLEYFSYLKTAYKGKLESVVMPVKDNEILDTQNISLDLSMKKLADRLYVFLKATNNSTVLDFLSSSGAQMRYPSLFVGPVKRSNNTGIQTDMILERDVRLWIEFNEEWPRNKSTDSYEVRVFQKLEAMGGQVALVNDKSVTSAYLRFKAGDDDLKKEIILEYFEFMKDTLGSRLRVMAPVKDNIYPQNIDNSVDQALSKTMKRLGDVIYKYFQEFSSSSLVSFMLDLELFKKYPLLQFEYDRLNYMFNWIVKAKDLPKVSNRTKPRFSDKIETALALEFRKFSDSKKRRLKTVIIRGQLTRKMITDK